MSGLIRLKAAMWVVIGLTATATAGVNEVRITGVTNTYFDWNSGTTDILGDASHTIEITFTASEGYTWLGTNAFEIYSPDGADWLYLEATRGQYIWDLPIKYTPPHCGTLESYLHHAYKAGGTGTFVKTPYAGQIQKCFEPEPTLIDDLYTTLPAGGNVNGNDTAAFFLGAVGSGVGYVGGSSGVALNVEFGALASDASRHICFDTCSQLISWEWAAAGYPLNGGSDYPTWDNGQGFDGPICWEIFPPWITEPEWCNGTSEVISGGYCQELTYQLCAESFFYPVTYAFNPPYDNGDYGSVNAETGLWTWSGTTLQPGNYSIRFLAYDHDMPSNGAFTLNVMVTTNGCDCCVGKVGDANGSGDDLPTIGDINAMIDHLFISEQALACYPEADANGSGGVYPHASDITIGDINLLIDYLFITGPEAFGPLPDCPVME